MIGRPPRYTAELANQILQELARGRGLLDICSEPGMPCDVTVWRWVTDDIEGFAARYAKARETGEPVFRSHFPTRYTAEIAERIVGGITSGRTVADVCSDPGMPSAGTVRNWVVSNREDFTARYREAQEIGRALSGGPIPYSTEIADRVLGELMQGRTLIEVCDGPGMPSVGGVLLWVRRDRDGFAARYREAREVGAQIMVDELILIGDDSRRDHARHRGEDGETELVVDHENIARSRLRCENRRWILSRALPRIYGDRLQVTTRHDAGDGWPELLKELESQPRGLPSEDDPADGQ
jgi:hypothetical protein